MINDTSIIESETVNVEGRSLKVERRRGLLGDHVVDILARAYAVNIRIEGSPEDASVEPIMSLESSKAIVKVMQ